MARVIPRRLSNDDFHRREGDGFLNWSRDSAKWPGQGVQASSLTRDEQHE